MSSEQKHALVWTEIPVRDLDKATAFYSEVFGYNMTRDDTGPNPIVFLTSAAETGVAGHLYPGTPAPKGTGTTIHLAVPDNVEATLKRFNDAGGEAHDMVIEIPVGRFAYGTDPDGNSIGIFQKTG